MQTRTYLFGLLIVAYQNRFDFDNSEEPIQFQRWDITLLSWTIIYISIHAICDGWKRTLAFSDGFEDGLAIRLLPLSHWPTYFSELPPDSEPFLWHFNPSHHFTDPYTLTDPINTSRYCPHCGIAWITHAANGNCRLLDDLTF